MAWLYKINWGRNWFHSEFAIFISETRKRKLHLYQGRKKYIFRQSGHSFSIKVLFILPKFISPWPHWVVSCRLHFPSSFLPFFSILFLPSFLPSFSIIFLSFKDDNTLYIWLYVSCFCSCQYENKTNIKKYSQHAIMRNKSLREENPDFNKEWRPRDRTCKQQLNTSSLPKIAHKDSPIALPVPRNNCQLYNKRDVSTVLVIHIYIFFLSPFVSTRKKWFWTLSTPAAVRLAGFLSVFLWFGTKEQRTLVESPLISWLMAGEQTKSDREPFSCLLPLFAAGNWSLC